MVDPAFWAADLTAAGEKLQKPFSRPKIQANMPENAY